MDALVKALRRSQVPDYGLGPMTQQTQAGRQNAWASNGPQRPNDYMAPVAEAISPTMGAYGAGQMAAEGSRAIGQGDYFGGGAGLAMGMAGMIPGAPKKGVRAFHGSPHDFDRFDMRKIGTGEGAQAYGHGLYFAENEGVAKDYKVASVGSAGHMYEVRINADPEDFLDWDKPLSQQSDKVKAAIPPDNWADGPDETGSWKAYVSSKDGHNDLKSKGVVGIRYLDQGSRTAGEGSSNYVVFDDALIEILKKYGLLGTLGGGGALAAAMQGKGETQY